MKKIILSFIILLMTTIAASADIYVVSSEKADVREADSEKAEVIGSLRKGMEINVSKIDGGFCQIDFMGVKGFVSINDLKFKSRSGKSSDGEDNVVDKTKGFVSNTSRKVADGVSGISGKLFGKKKQKSHSDPEVVEEAEVSAKEENTPAQPASGLLIVVFDEGDDRIVLPRHAGVGVDVVEQRVDGIAEPVHLPLAVEVHHHFVQCPVGEGLGVVRALRVEMEGEYDQMDVDALLLQFRDQVIPAVEIEGIDLHVVCGVLAACI